MKQQDFSSRNSRQPVLLLAMILFLLLMPHRPLAQVISNVPLIFDPVLLEFVDPDPDTRQEYQVRELSVLPSRLSTEDSPLDDSLIMSGAMADTPVLYQESIAQFEIEGGPYDSRLSEAYLSLGEVYQQLGDYQQAIEAFNNALHINRINNGLYNPGQLAIVSELVDSYLSSGDFMAANQQQEYLFFVQQKIYGPNNPILLSGLLEYGDWNLQAASLSLGYIPDLNTLGLREVPRGTESLARSLNRFDNQALLQLNLAANAYTQALRLQRQREEISLMIDESSRVQIQTGSQLNDRDLNIPETESKLAYTHFLLSRLLENVPVTNLNGDGEMYFSSLREGQNALQRRLNYLQNANFPDMEIVMALVDIADWFLLNERWSSAEEIYIQASELISSNNLEEVPGLNYRDLPAPIPSFASPFYSRSSNSIPADAPLEYDGYIDVSFELTRLGYTSNIEFLNQTENTHEETVDALRRMLRRTQFRLQLTNGAEDSAEYADNHYLVRYYYTTQPVPESDPDEESDEEADESREG